MTPALPIHAVLPGLLAALREGANAVLVAPPGAGKTAAVAPALLAEAWCAGEVLLLSPRRLAARAAAERMTQVAGEPAGRTYGYATRLDTKRSRQTRVTVVTEGIFANRIHADPELPGISAVLFDEVRPTLRAIRQVRDRKDPVRAGRERRGVAIRRRHRIEEQAPCFATSRSRRSSCRSCSRRPGPAPSLVIAPAARTGPPCW